MDGECVITCGYGVRLDPITKRGYEFHHAIDIGAKTGDDILAAGSGTVTFSGSDSIYGYMITV
jgi:murein DD-endopeptidase MepM/ murein hydrolase activator NlpD